MKKIYTLAALLLATSTASFAQKTIDLGVAITSPTSGQVFTAGSSIPVKIVFTNNGPGSIAAGDSLLYTDDGTNFYFITGRTKGVGDTIQENYNLNSDPDIDNGTYNYSVLGFMINRVGGVNTITDPDTTNDIATTSFVITGSTGFKNVEVTKANSYRNGVEILAMAPNPAVNEVSLNYVSNSANNVVARVTDIAGRAVLTQDFGASFNGKSNFKLNLSELTNGIYFIELTEGDRRSVGKLIKQ